MQQAEDAMSVKGPLQGPCLQRLLEAIRTCTLQAGDADRRFNGVHSVHGAHLAHTIIARALKVRSSCPEAASHMQALPSRLADSRKVLSRDQSRSFTASSWPWSTCRQPRSLRQCLLAALLQASHWVAKKNPQEPLNGHTLRLSQHLLIDSVSTC